MEILTYLSQVDLLVKFRWELHLLYKLLVLIPEFDILVNLCASIESSTHCFVIYKY